MTTDQLLALFHHVHHRPDHVVHHSGGEHRDGHPMVNHCTCGLHSIDVQEHQQGGLVIRFVDECPDGGWHVESGCRD